ncbi:transposase [Candidatus Omnitrophota bacterium]
MPRLPRIYIKGILYYVTCRGIHNQNIFKDKEDYRMFLELLKKYQQQYGIRLFSFVLLPDHLHLLLEVTGEENDISGFMHSLNNTYTKYFNGRYERKGHLFQGRFKAALVEKAPNLSTLTAYMHLNPKRLHLVNDLKDYPHSSYGHYLNEPKDSQFNLQQEIAEVLSLLQGKGYEDLVNQLNSEQGDELHKRLQRGGIVGSEEFIDRIRQEVDSYKARSDNHQAAEENKRYRLFVITGSVILIVLAGISGIYFYFTTRDRGNQRILTRAVIKAEELDTTEWEVRLVPVSEGEPQVDTLSFTQGKFISGKLNTQGYSTSNYTLTIEESGKIIWETMQTGPEGTASWRGEIEQGIMRGILSLRQEGQEPQDFSFMSIKYRRRWDETGLL